VAHAAIDVSDGLLGDLGHILHRSGVGAEIQTRWLEGSPATSADLLDLLQTRRLDMALAGGDDYELLMAVPVRKRAALQRASRAAGIKVTRIGAFSKGRGVRLTVSGQLVKAAVRGYTHF